MNDGELRAYLNGLQVGDRVVETGLAGLSEMTGRDGTVYLGRREEICVKWDLLPSDYGHLETPVTLGTRRIIDLKYHNCGYMIDPITKSCKRCAAKSDEEKELRSAAMDILDKWMRKENPIGPVSTLASNAILLARNYLTEHPKTDIRQVQRDTANDQV